MGKNDTVDPKKGKKNSNLIGWQTLDIYQNLNITYLFSIEKNRKIDKNLFKIPPRE